MNLSRVARYILYGDQSGGPSGLQLAAKAGDGNAAGARGHVDCMKIIRDRAVAKAILIVTVPYQ